MLDQQEAQLNENRNQDKFNNNESESGKTSTLSSDQIIYTQSPIIKNGPIKNDAQILGKFKERTLSRSKLRNA